MYRMTWEPINGFRRRIISYRPLDVDFINHLVEISDQNQLMSSNKHISRTLLYKLRSVQNTGTCYPGQGWFVRNPGVPDKSSRGLGSMSRHSAQIFVSFIACIFLFITRGQFWPSGIVVACVCVCVSVCLSVCTSVCPHFAFVSLFAR